jgi:DNA-damage-inducible protein D
MSNLSQFETIKHIDEDNKEYWTARELYRLLDYSEYRHFTPVIDKAREACINSGIDYKNHIEKFLYMVNLGSGAKRELSDYKLTRYACYLIVQNGDPSKSIIAQAQTYFALQTRRQELSDEEQFNALSEDNKRLQLRGELSEHNKSLVATAKKAGVETTLDYAVFQDSGYKGLYGGLGAKDIHSKKQLKKSQKILDYMGSTELAANLFRATQTEDKLKRENTKSKAIANKTHNEVGKKVRQTIKDLGGTMPEDLPKPELGIAQVERRLLKKENGNDE